MSVRPALAQPAAPSRAEFKVKGSRFIAEIGRVTSEEEIHTALEEIRRRERGATHHCFAWRIGDPETGTWRVNDDGEPAGTAGKPILQALDGQRLSNSLAVVTRYFGGTKLGKGGLIRAYGDVTRLAIQALRKKPFVPMTRYHCTVSFADSKLVYRVLEKYKALLDDQDFGTEVRIAFRVQSDQADALSWELHELSQGRIRSEPS